MENIHNKFIQEKNKGVTVKELCSQFNISKSTAYNWIKLYSPIKRPERETITAHKIYQMGREIQSLRTENEIFKRSGCGLNSPLDEKIAAIERLKGDFSIYSLCKTLNILRSTYYHRVLRSPEKTQYEIADEKLRPLITEIFINSRERFGAQKIKFVLKQQGYNISRAHISRLMQEMGLVCKQLQLRHFSTTSRKYKVYKNRIQQKFMTDAPNMIWVSDITYVHVEDILCAIGVIIDLYARNVIAFDVAETADSAVNLCRIARLRELTLLYAAASFARSVSLRLFLQAKKSTDSKPCGSPSVALAKDGGGGKKISNNSLDLKTAKLFQV